ncbi:MAG TPA: Kdo hydroxylase family protein [Tepidisphaeraceae bacterium]|nr:Kdo hydroxylase family protein [Tepidisphaeraceae bacterium]
MAAQIQVTDYKHPGGYTSAVDAARRAREYCRQLEEGAILFLDSIPYPLPQDDVEFLLEQRQGASRFHKNISYRPKSDLLRGTADEDPQGARRLHEIMRNFSNQVMRFVDSFLAPYATDRQLDYASYRPIEEKGRDLSCHKRNDLMHVDAFPTRPTNGGRILRVFTNINPTANRVWEVSEPFEPLAGKLAGPAGLDRFAKYARSPMRKVRQTVAPLLRPLGMRTLDRSPYDQFMLHFHDWLKENAEYQKNWPKTRLEFPPRSTWLVYTDTVPHSVLSGQFALEQTFIVPMSAMVVPQKTPLKILESLCGIGLAN